MEKLKLKCLPRVGNLAEYKYKLENYSRVRDLSLINNHDIISFIPEGDLDEEISDKTWYEVLLIDKFDDHEASFYLHEVDEYGKPLTQAKLKKKYGEESDTYKRALIALKDYGCTKRYYSDFAVYPRLVLKANVYRDSICTNPYRNKYKDVLDIKLKSETVLFPYFNEEGYKILKNKPENYDPEFDNGTGYHSDKDFEGVEVTIYGDWNTRKIYRDEYNAYKERESNRPKGVIDRMYSPWGDIWCTLRKVATDKGMTEDDFSTLKELLQSSKGWGYKIDRSVKEFCKKFPGLYPYAKKFVEDEWKCYIEAYNNSGWS